MYAVSRNLIAAGVTLVIAGQAHAGMLAVEPLGIKSLGPMGSAILLAGFALAAMIQRRDRRERRTHEERLVSAARLEGIASRARRS